MAFTEGEYTPAERRRNRRTIVAVATAAGVGFAATALMTSWAWTNALWSFALVAGFCTCCWWMFGSRKAGPIGVSQSTVAWFRNVASPFGRRK